MKKLKHLATRAVFLLPVILLLLGSCSEENPQQNERAQKNQAIEKFTSTLSKLNAPENAEKHATESDSQMLKRRIEFLYPDSRELLLASGVSEPELAAMTVDETVSRAVRCYVTYKSKRP